MTVEQAKRSRLEERILDTEIEIECEGNKSAPDYDRIRRLEAKVKMLEKMLPHKPRIPDDLYY